MNNINEIPRTSFAVMPALRSIYASNNSIYSLPIDLFELCNKIEDFVIDSNAITFIPPSINSTDTLTSILASNNRIIFCPPLLRSNHATRVDLSGNFLSITPSLGRYVTFFAADRNRIATVGPIAPKSDLLTISLNHNCLTHFPTNLTNLHLSFLFLSHNYLRSVPLSLSRMHTLHTLDLSFNQLDHVPSCVFFLPNLTKLNLAFNKISSVPPWLFILPSLRVLNMSGNLIAELPSPMKLIQIAEPINFSSSEMVLLASFQQTRSFFEEMVSAEWSEPFPFTSMFTDADKFDRREVAQTVRELCELAGVEVVWEAQMEVIEREKEEDELDDLYDNPLDQAFGVSTHPSYQRHFFQPPFTPLSARSGTSQSDVFPTFKRPQSPSRSFPHSPAKLLSSSLPISAAATTILNKLPNVVHLVRPSFSPLVSVNFSCNHLTALPPCLQLFHNLHTLLLSDNVIESVPSTLFHTFPFLQRVDLSFNNIRTLPHDLFDGPLSLVFFDVSHNLIDSFPVSLIRDLASRLDIIPHSERADPSSDNPVSRNTSATNSPRARGRAMTPRLHQGLSSSPSVKLNTSIPPPQTNGQTPTTSREGTSPFEKRDYLEPPKIGSPLAGQSLFIPTSQDLITARDGESRNNLSLSQTIQYSETTPSVLVQQLWRTRNQKEEFSAPADLLMSFSTRPRPISTVMELLSAEHKQRSLLQSKVQFECNTDLIAMSSRSIPTNTIASDELERPDSPSDELFQSPSPFQEAKPLTPFQLFNNGEYTNTVQSCSPLHSAVLNMLLRRTISVSSFLTIQNPLSLRSAPVLSLQSGFPSNLLFKATTNLNTPFLIRRQDSQSFFGAPALILNLLGIGVVKGGRRLGREVKRIEMETEDKLEKDETECEPTPPKQEQQDAETDLANPDEPEAENLNAELEVQTEGKELPDGDEVERSEVQEKVAIAEDTPRLSSRTRNESPSPDQHNVASPPRPPPLPIIATPHVTRSRPTSKFGNVDFSFNRIGLPPTNGEVDALFRSLLQSLQDTSSESLQSVDRKDKNEDSPSQSEPSSASKAKRGLNDLTSFLASPSTPFSAPHPFLDTVLAFSPAYSNLLVLSHMNSLHFTLTCHPATSHPAAHHPYLAQSSLWILEHQLRDSIFRMRRRNELPVSVQIGDPLLRHPPFSAESSRLFIQTMQVINTPAQIPSTKVQIDRALKQKTFCLPFTLPHSGFTTVKITSDKTPGFGEVLDELLDEVREWRIEEHTASPEDISNDVVQTVPTPPCDICRAYAALDDSDSSSDEDELSDLSEDVEVEAPPKRSLRERIGNWFDRRKKEKPKGEPLEIDSTESVHRVQVQQPIATSQSPDASEHESMTNQEVTRCLELIDPLNLITEECPECGETVLASRFDSHRQFECIFQQPVQQEPTGQKSYIRSIANQVTSSQTPTAPLNSPTSAETPPQDDEEGFVIRARRHETLAFMKEWNSPLFSQSEDELMGPTEKLRNWIRVKRKRTEPLHRVASCQQFGQLSKMKPTKERRAHRKSPKKTEKKEVSDEGTPKGSKNIQHPSDSPQKRSTVQKAKRFQQKRILAQSRRLAARAIVKQHHSFGYLPCEDGLENMIGDADCERPQVFTLKSADEVVNVDSEETIVESDIHILPGNALCAIKPINTSRIAGQGRSPLPMHPLSLSTSALSPKSQSPSSTPLFSDAFTAAPFCCSISETCGMRMTMEDNVILIPCGSWDLEAIVNNYEVDLLKLLILLPSEERMRSDGRSRLDLRMEMMWRALQTSRGEQVEQLDPEAVEVDVADITCPYFVPDMSSGGVFGVIDGHKSADVSNCVFARFSNVFVMIAQQFISDEKTKADNTTIIVTGSPISDDAKRHQDRLDDSTLSESATSHSLSSDSLSVSSPFVLSRPNSSLTLSHTHIDTKSKNSPKRKTFFPTINLISNSFKSPITPNPTHATSPISTHPHSATKPAPSKRRPALTRTQSLLSRILKATMEELAKYIADNQINAGAVGNVCCVTKDHIHCANIGDSRAVLVSLFRENGASHSPVHAASQFVDQLGYTKVKPNRSSAEPPPTLAVRRIGLTPNTQNNISASISSLSQSSIPHSSPSPSLSLVPPIFPLPPHTFLAAHNLSNDHAPASLTERLFIHTAGGSVSGEGRVNGILMPSRVFGDLESKRMARSDPDIFCERIRRWKWDDWFGGRDSSSSTPSSISLGRPQQTSLSHRSSSAQRNHPTLPTSSLFSSSSFKLLTPSPSVPPSLVPLLDANLTPSQPFVAPPFDKPRMQRLHRNLTHPPWSTLATTKTAEEKLQDHLSQGLSKGHDSMGEWTMESVVDMQCSIDRPHILRRKGRSSGTSSDYSVHSSSSQRWEREDVALVVGCDGVFDVLDAQGLAELVCPWMDATGASFAFNSHFGRRRRWNTEASLTPCATSCLAITKGDLAEIAAVRIRNAATSLESQDNISVLVVFL
ncbi:putative leucine-rich repeat domain-containing protein [Blattamonas nauphoetae]|uniref:Leucine-rich repeat domain-containing protein n=1 Tax=Blattamonas nauphoetae TaxID=2049346 RepID=A0ABQ9X3X0_9EUKA|nr:putative leucine-rich repeat domain-containing protein [Blattamonas nauphoetae]